MIKLHENFFPVKAYSKYLALSTAIITVLLIAVCTVWIPWIFLGTNKELFIPAWFVILAIAVAGIIWVCIWAALYYHTVIYQMNETEISWKRGVLFRQTGIVPYNRITNVDIVQGPLMRLFGVHNLKIDTASGSGTKKAEIRLEGMENPEPLRDLIMTYVRGMPPAPGAVGAEFKPNTELVDMQTLIEEVKKIRKLLESQK